MTGAAQRVVTLIIREEEKNVRAVGRKGAGANQKSKKSGSKHATGQRARSPEPSSDLLKRETALPT